MFRLPLVILRLFIIAFIALINYTATYGTSEEKIENRAYIYGRQANNQVKNALKAQLGIPIKNIRAFPAREYDAENDRFLVLFEISNGPLTKVIDKQGGYYYIEQNEVVLLTPEELDQYE
jgi:hypothetical protein